MCAIQTIYGQLENTLGVDLTPAPDRWDRLYNVDFFIEVNKKYIGIQMRSFASEQAFEKSKSTEFLETSCKFMKKFGGGFSLYFMFWWAKRNLSTTLRLSQKSIKKSKG